MSRPRSDQRISVVKTAGIEALEPRCLLSVSTHLKNFYHAPVNRSVQVHVTAVRNRSKTSAVPTDVVIGKPVHPVARPAGGVVGLSAFTPSQLRALYGVNGVSFNNVAGDGTGQTIAIVVAYDQPELVNTGSPAFDTSDLHLFDQQFGLPDPPSFYKVAEISGGTLPAQQQADWSIEASMDVEWSHAMAPGANIVLVEANSSSVTDLLQNAAVTAKNIPGVVAVSMSFTFGESAADTSIDPLFLSPSFQNVTFLAAAGDAGAASTGYPALSPDVVAVGGTTITMSAGGNYQSETTWNDYHGATGGGPSAVESRPGYQSNIKAAGSTRTVPDVSFDASPSTGVYVFDSALSGTGGSVYDVGGTSLATPCWAALVAIADQGRQLEGLAPLDGSSQTLPRLYALPASDFHDVTTGNNAFYCAGYSAGYGYDMTTGRGTPIASQLVPDLAGGATVSGYVFQDTNGDGSFDSADTPVAGQQVFVDLNNNGVADPGDPIVTTNSAGFYWFGDQVGHEAGTVRLAPPINGSSPTYFTTGSPVLTTAYGTTDTVDFGLAPVPAGTGYTLALDPTGSQMQLSAGGTVTQSTAVGSESSLTIQLPNNGDSLTIDGTNGNPLPASGITVIGIAGGGNSLNLIGTAGADAVSVQYTTIQFDGVPIRYRNVSAVNFTPGTGTTSLAVWTGSVAITAGQAGGGIDTLQFSSLAIGGTARLTFNTAAAHSDRTLVLTRSLAINTGGTIDLGGNDMVVVGGAGSTGSVSAVNGLTDTGDALGQWTGTGLASSAAAADRSHLTALGVALGSAIPAGKTFDGYAPAAADVLVKYTYYGDANLDGTVDGSDYSLLDAAYTAQVTGWAAGDFDGDGVVDGSDYSLIDNAYNNQRAVL